jgi:flagellar hook-associated protein 3 FlgL
VTGVRDTLDRFDTLHSKLVSARAQVGSRMSGLSSAMKSIERQDLTAAHLNSQLEDADMARVMADMAKEETVFRSTLQSSTRLVQPTLMDFLR